MATSYTRQSSMSDGDTITAALFNDEFNQLLTAFHMLLVQLLDTGMMEHPVKAVIFILSVIRIS